MQIGFVNRFIRPKKRFVKDHFVKPIKGRLEFELARRYRTVLGAIGKVCFIGITGSCGKTTTTELIAVILANEGQVKKGSHANTIDYIAKTILAVRSRHRFCVNEVSGHTPKAMEESAKLLRPQIGVVTNIGQDHYSNYRSLKSTAAEKGKLIEVLPVGGTAVLNMDDPYVCAMQKRTKAQIITYGLSADVMVRGENVSCDWPMPMSLDVCYAKNRLHIQTQLLGKYWAYSVLAALATGIAVGISPERAIQAIETFVPVPGRMSLHKTPDGVTFICDYWKASLWIIPASLDFMRTAKAERKIIVIGSISDTPKSFYDRYRVVIRQSFDVADKIIFVGDHARSAIKERPHTEDGRIMAFDTLYHANSFLSDYLKAGDLVLLKGTENNDHLQRIVLSRTGDIACWREKCGILRFCSDCKRRHNPSVPNDRL